jgi:hypothetical protein
MGTQRVQMKRVLSWLVRWNRRASTVDICLAFDALISPVENIIFLTVHFFTFLVPIIQQPGQAGVLGRLSLCLLHTYESFLTSGQVTVECLAGILCLCPGEGGVEQEVAPGGGLG